jgi:hypothetical protein
MCVPPGFKYQFLQLVSHPDQSPTHAPDGRKYVRPLIWVFSGERCGWGFNREIVVVEVPPNTPALETLEGDLYAVYAPDVHLLAWWLAQDLPVINTPESRMPYENDPQKTNIIPISQAVLVPSAERTPEPAGDQTDD